jgi:hypothetical protein
VRNYFHIVLILMLQFIAASSGWASSIKPLHVYMMADDYVVQKTEQVKTSDQNGMQAYKEVQVLTYNHEMNENNAIFDIPVEMIQDGWKISSISAYGTWQKYYCGYCGRLNCDYMPMYNEVNCKSEPSVEISADGSRFFLSETNYPEGSYFQNEIFPHRGRCIYKVEIERVVENPTTSSANPGGSVVKDYHYGVYVAQYLIPKPATKNKTVKPVGITWLMDTSASMTDVINTVKRNIPSLAEKMFSRIENYQNYVINADGTQPLAMDRTKLSHQSDLAKDVQSRYLSLMIQSLPKGSDIEKPLRSYLTFLSSLGRKSLENTQQYLVLFTDEDDSSDLSGNEFVQELMRNFPKTKFTLFIFSKSGANDKYNEIVSAGNVQKNSFNLLNENMNEVSKNLEKLTYQILQKEGRPPKKDNVLALPNAYNIHKVLKVQINGNDFNDYAHDSKTNELLLNDGKMNSTNAQVIFAGYPKGRK